MVAQAETLNKLSRGECCFQVHKKERTLYGLLFWTIRLTLCPNRAKTDNTNYGVCWRWTKSPETDSLLPTKNGPHWKQSWRTRSQTNGHRKISWQTLKVCWGTWINGMEPWACATRKLPAQHRHQSNEDIVCQQLITVRDVDWGWGNVFAMLECPTWPLFRTYSAPSITLANAVILSFTCILWVSRCNPMGQAPVVVSLLLTILFTYCQT